MLPHVASEEIAFEKKLSMKVNEWSVSLVKIYLVMLISAYTRGQE